MPSAFQIEMEKLKNRIITMGSLVEEQLSRAVDSLISGDITLLERISDIEGQVDRIDVKVDKLCQRIFALQQPVASDLRFIMSTMKIHEELERIGDIAFNISQLTIIIKDHIEFVKELEVDTIATSTNKLVKDAIDSFINKDLEKANEILVTGFQINEKCMKIFNDILTRMVTKSEVIVAATNLILILRHLERIADHSRNIGESVIFMIEGKNVKHKKLIKENDENE
jgi:phosphate transport system protein